MSFQPQDESILTSQDVAIVELDEDYTFDVDPVDLSSTSDAKPGSKCKIYSYGHDDSNLQMVVVTVLQNGGIFVMVFSQLHSINHPS